MTTSMSGIFDRKFKRGAETRRFLIRPEGWGWVVQEEVDSQVIREARFTDWHRVERARNNVTKEVSLLQRDGWVEA